GSPSPDRARVGSGGVYDLDAHRRGPHPQRLHPRREDRSDRRRLAIRRRGWTPSRPHPRRCRSLGGPGERYQRGPGRGVALSEEGAIPPRVHEAGVPEHRAQLVDAVDADVVRARGAPAGVVPQALGLVQDAARRIEAAVGPQRPTARQLSVLVNGEASVELLAVERLDDKPTAGDQNAAKFAQRALVAGVTKVPERRAETEDGVEPPGTEREAGIAAAHEDGPAGAPGRSPSSREQGCRAVEGDYAVARAGEGD